MTDQRRPSLSVIIVNFNSTPLLAECLRSLEASTVADQLQVIVVDNASTDFNVEVLRGEHPSVIFLPQERNTTYTGGNNIGFGEATAELVLMLNPDTRLEPDALERALAHMAEEPDLAALTAYLIGPDEALQRYYRRLPEFADLPVMLFEPIFRNTARGRRYLMLDEPFDRVTDVQDPPGAFILMRRSALGSHLLDPGYFNFVSDLELCDRLNRAGRVAMFPDVRCHHQRAGAGVGTTDPQLRLRLYEDYVWGLRRYIGARLTQAQAALLEILVILYWASRVAWIAFRRRVLAAALAAAGDSLRGRPPTY
jgi:GT2 family glycosyltransferase